MYRIGLSTKGFSLNEEVFEKMSDSGVSAIEIALQRNELEALNYNKISDFSKRYNIELWSLHFPFVPFTVIDISSPNNSIRKSSVELYMNIIEKATDIGIDKFVVHPSTAEPIPDDEREERFRYSMQSLDELAQCAYKHGAIVAVEDLPRSCLGKTVDEMLRLISANDKLRVCFDTNHLLNDSHKSFIEKLGDKIITLHISDYDFIDEKHWLPGEGMIDWVEIISLLKKINYSGVWMYEVNLQTPNTITRKRDLNFSDFIENANAIFSGQKPPRI